MGTSFGLRSLLLSLSVLLAFSLVLNVSAQSSSSTSVATNSTTRPSFTVFASNLTSTFTSTAAGRTFAVTTVIPTNVTSTLSPSSTTNATGTATSSTSPTSTAIALDTRVDPGFGVLGAILIITGLPSTFWGHKNRWSSFFLIGFYTFSLACLALILKFGVLEAVNPPSEKLRGVFVLACVIAGVGGGGVSIFFWQQSKYFIGAWGGFAIGLWVQCFRDGGLIRPVGFRWIMYIALGVVGFTLCTIPRMHYHVLLVSTAAVGATAFILGLDCYTTANLKEFYIWNLGFDSLFVKFQSKGIEFPLSQMMEIELGLIGAFTLMGAAVQLRILKILQFKLREISREQKRRDEELEAQAVSRFKETEKELEEWEKEHGRKDSHISSIPLMKDQELASPGTEETSAFTLVHDQNRRSRYQSGLSDFAAAPPPEDDNRAVRQGMGALPVMDLGFDIEDDLQEKFDTPRDVGDSKDKGSTSALTSEELKKKEELMAEIQSIRKSIEKLRAETPSIGSETRSRQHSFTSRRTLSLGFAEALETPARPPRAQNPRDRILSMDYLSQGPDGSMARGASIDRPSSAPLSDAEEWNNYVRERKLFQPPAGPSPPLSGTPIAPQPRKPHVPIPPSVTEALARRYQQEIAIETGDFSSGSQGRASSQGSMTDERPLSRAQMLMPKKPALAAMTSGQVTILPPRKSDPSGPTRSPPTRVRTFEELNERHREKLRNLQAPLSQATREQAELEAAKNRWERSKEVEKQVMARRDAEKAAAAKATVKKKTRGDLEGQEDDGRALSADRLHRLPGGGSGKRQSVLKVEDWRRYQQEVDETPLQTKHSTSKSDSRIPFPASRDPGQRPSGERRRPT